MQANERPGLSEIICIFCLQNRTSSDNKKTETTAENCLFYPLNWLDNYNNYLHNYVEYYSRRFSNNFSFSKLLDYPSKRSNCP
ncbi:unnamed protein product, partial [Nesidiocoris tenuis]